MEPQRQYLALVATLVLSVLATTVLIAQNGLNTILAGSMIVLAYVSIEYALRKSRKEGRTKRFRALISFTKVFFELALLFGLLMLPTVPKFLALLVVSSVAVTEIFSLKLLEQLQSRYRTSLGWKGRIAAVTVSVFGLYFNENFAFIGALLILGITIYDFTSIMMQLYTNLAD